MATQLVQFSSLINRDVFQSGSLSEQSKVDLKDYFVSVKTRFESGEEFPYSLDELVPTVFTDKQRAADALKRDFVQDTDFISSIARSNDNPKPKIDYRLSPLTFEFMVARKNKDIFSLYHTVFHLKTAPVPPGMTDLDLMIQQNAMIGKAILEMKSQREAMQALQQDVAEIKAALPSPQTHTTIRAFAAIHNIRLTPRIAQRLGKRCAHLSLQTGKAINHVADDLYGTVNAYLNDIVEQVFADYAQEARP